MRRSILANANQRRREALQESNMLPAHGWVAVETSAVAIVQCHGISQTARDALSEC